MRRIEGSAGVKLIECTHPVKNKWRIRWDVQGKEDGSATYMEEEFNHKPTEEEIKQTIIGWINSQTDQAILSGFEWNGTTCQVFRGSAIHTSLTVNLYSWIP